MTKCFASSDEQKDIKTFPNENQDLLISKIDKSKNIALFEKTDYIKKLEFEFNNNSYIKLKSSPLQEDLKLFRKLIKEMKPFVSKKHSIG